MHILFVCTGNTCRSPMAERLGRLLHPAHVFESAGVIPAGGIHPLTRRVLIERGAVAEGFECRDVATLELESYDTIVLIGETARSLCPGLPPHTAVHYWEVKDPIEADGTEDEMLHAYRACANELILRIGRLVTSGSAD